MAQHQEDVVREVLQSVNPGHGHGLEEDGGQQGQPGRVVLQQTEYVDTALGSRGLLEVTAAEQTDKRTGVTHMMATT